MLLRRNKIQSADQQILKEMDGSRIRSANFCRVDESAHHIAFVSNYCPSLASVLLEMPFGG
jgi:hypothetical protein